MGFGTFNHAARMYIRGDESVTAIVRRFNAPEVHVDPRLAQLRREQRKLRKPVDDLPEYARGVGLCAEASGIRFRLFSTFKVRASRRGRKLQASR